MRKIIFLSLACLMGLSAMAQVQLREDEVTAVKFVQGQTTDWYMLADNPEVTFTDHNPVIKGKTYDLTNGNVETTFGIPLTPIDEWKTVRENMTTGYYGTLCWNYNLTAIEGAELYTIAGIENNRIVLEEVKAEETEAGAGYVILATAETLRVKNGDQYAKNPIIAENNNGLQGTFEEIVDGAAGTAGNILEDKYIVYNNEWRKCGGYTGLKANRAYLILNAMPYHAPAPAPGRKYISMPLPSEVPTSLGGEAERLKGGRAMKVIENGHFMIVRDNKMYNATGIEIR